MMFYYKKPTSFISYHLPDSYVMLKILKYKDKKFYKMIKFEKKHHWLLIFSFVFACMIIFIYLFKPAIYIKPNFKQMDNISQRKAAFINYLLPLVNQVQNNILSERNTIKKIQRKLNKQKTLSSSDHRTLKNLSKQYHINDNNLTINEVINELLVRVNTIPTSMVLAQAALETGWGTSRFATVGNNYFGQHCFSKNCGIAPKFKPNNRIDEVKVFSNPLDSVHAYFKLLNTGSKFSQFREVRDRLSSNVNTKMDAQKLIQTLVHYSELEQGEYETRLLNTINYNRLYELS